MKTLKKSNHFFLLILFSFANGRGRRAIVELSASLEFAFYKEKGLTNFLTQIERETEESDGKIEKEFDCRSVGRCVGGGR
jgi:hypothetical protein